MLRPKLHLITTILAMLALVTGGCVRSFPHPVGVQLEVPCDEFMEQRHISKEVEVPINGMLTVTLCSNPTTGFQWSETAEITDPSVLDQVDHEFVPPEQKGVEGASGQEVWSFRAFEKGTSTISVEYRRLWEHGVEPAKTFTLTVVVK